MRIPTQHRSLADNITKWNTQMQKPVYQNFIQQTETNEHRSSANPSHQPLKEDRKEHRDNNNCKASLKFPSIVLGFMVLPHMVVPHNSIICVLLSPSCFQVWGENAGSSIDMQGHATYDEVLLELTRQDIIVTVYGVCLNMPGDIPIDSQHVPHWDRAQTPSTWIHPSHHQVTPETGWQLTFKMGLYNF